MATIKETAQAYTPPQTKNIAELDKVPTDVDVLKETHQKKDSNETFDINVIELDGERYRVPNSVLEGLKAHLEENPELLYFKVKKTGEGMKTKYTVIPLTNEVL